MLYFHFFCDMNKNGRKMQQRLQMTVVNSSDAVNEWSLDYYYYYRQHVKLSGPLLIYMYIYHSSNFLFIFNHLPLSKK